MKGAITARIAKYRSFRRQVYLVLEGGHTGGPVGRFVESFLIILIILNVVGFTLQSVPSIRQPYWFDLDVFEAVSVAIFTVEYGLRLWVSVEDPLIREMGRWRGRLGAALKPLMLIDFFAVAPVYFTLFFPALDLRFLRLVRLLRLLKIARYSPALSTLGRVVVNERRALFGTLLVLLCATIFAAAAMHAVEGAVQPERFGTIPSSMWWAIATLTTVGYGDAVPITFLGRLVAGCTMVVGLGILALPVGIVATGFMDTIRRRDFVVTFGMLARVPLFKDFDAHLLSEILDLLRAQSVSKGDIIAVKGAPAHAMYFIVSGQVEAELPHRNIRFGPGDFFGELALLHETQRRATLVALSQCRLLALAAEDFAMLIRKHPALKKRLEEAAQEHIKAYGGDESDFTRSEMAAAGKVHGWFREDD
ncbi:MAG: ion transporter [Alphaproteobacteria bacterium]|nr:ion transporter [Alphaproteobacteria bacterium]MDE2631277.1 ion transporter [Alphaproteobacteria bacterium]